MTRRSSCTSCTILVVDDDRELASTLCEFLQNEGYAVEVALSAAEALACRSAIAAFAWRCST